jgi:isocitrate/isopropylmalate dehydrogenase
MPDLAMALRSTSSARRFRKAGLTSACSKSAADLAEIGHAPPAATIAAMAASICLVTSGRAGAPSCVENLMPLYSGGLCEAVKLIAPEVFRVWTA